MCLEVAQYSHKINFMDYLILYVNVKLKVCSVFMSLILWKKQSSAYKINHEFCLSYLLLNGVDLT